jgi:hypothetical protein
MKKNKETGNKSESNVLLVSMSTFRYDKDLGMRTASQNAYSYEIEGLGKGNVYGFSQLEPVPRMLEENNIKLKKIIILATPQTLNDCSVHIIPGDNGDETDEEISPVHFFEKQMKSSTTAEFIPITLMEDNIKKSFAEAIKKITPQGGEQVKLYVDNHGGLRSYQQILDALLSLLDSEQNITLKGMYSISGDAPSFKIVNAMETNDILSFTSGMNEFFSFGRSKSLIRFFKKRSDNAASEIVNEITEITNALQMNDMNAFDRELAKLKKLLSDEKFKGENNDSDSYLSIFKDRIKEDYHKLLEKHNTVDTLEWCMEKEFYQQALTLIESKIPAELINKGIIEPNYMLELDVTTSGDVEEHNVMYWLEHTAEPWKLKENKLIEKIGVIVLGKGRNRYLNLANLLKEPIDKQELIGFPDDNKYEYAIVKTNDKIYDGKKHYVLKDTMCKASVRLKDVNDCKTFNRFLQLHMALKNQRNIVCHASGEPRATNEQITNAINIYINTLRKLYDAIAREDK